MLRQFKRHRSGRGRSWDGRPGSGKLNVSMILGGQFICKWHRGFASSLFPPTPPLPLLAFHLVPRGLARHTIYAEYLIMPIVSPVTCTVAWTRASSPGYPARPAEAFKARDFGSWIFRESINGADLYPPAASGSGDGRYAGPRVRACARGLLK